MTSVLELGFEEEEEEVMNEDLCGTMYPEEGEGFFKSARTSEEEILPSTFSKQELTGFGANGKRRSDRRNRKFEAYNKNDVTKFIDKSCKICSQSFMVSRGTNSVKVSRYQIAHHMFSQHYGGEILNLLDVKQTSCEICGRKSGSRSNLARHVGEVHELATKMYSQDKRNEQLVDTNPNTIPSPEVFDQKVDIILPERNVRRRRSMDCHLQLKKPGVSKRIRPRRLVRGLKCREVPARRKVVVEVISAAPIIEDLNLNNIENDVGADGMARRRIVNTRPVRLEEPLPAHLSSRLLVHGRNSVAWRVGEDEEYSECVMDWVKTRQVRNIMEFGDLTVGEGAFFCLWNQFMLERGFVGSVGMGHMARLVDRFVGELGRKVMEDKLYRQFVLHLGQLEREAVLSKEEVLRLVIKIQQIV